MDAIRNFKTIYYNCSLEYKDRRVKKNAYLAVAISLNIDVASVRQWYNTTMHNTIRTNFSKYIKNLMRTAETDIETTWKSELITSTVTRWLITHMVAKTNTRQNNSYVARTFY